MTIDDIEILFERIAQNPSHLIVPAITVSNGVMMSLPKNCDLVRFYRLCNGLILHKDSNYQLTFASMDNFVQSNEEILGENYPEDISDSWYVLARGGTDEYISIKSFAKGSLVQSSSE